MKKARKMLTEREREGEGVRAKWGSGQRGKQMREKQNKTK